MPLNKKTYPFFLLILCFLTNCSSSVKKIKPLSQGQLNKMDQALLFMKTKEYLTGAKIYDELSQSLKDKSTKNFMLFNAGVAYKEAGQCKKALSRFCRLLDYSLKQASFKARGLIEISYIYECLGKDELAFLSLKDAEKHLSSLPWILSQVIHPARLAIAHARLGQTATAEHYRSLSLTRVLQSKTAFSSEKELNEQVSRMFYLMGRSYIQEKHIKPPSFFKAFSYHQLYLLQSLFLKDKTWSKLAEKELSFLFDKLIFSLSKSKNKQKYEKELRETIREAQILIQKEKSKKWENFYFKKSNPVLKLFSQSP